MLEALANAPEWLQWMVAIGAPVTAFFGRDVWAWFKEWHKANQEREEKFVERRSSRVDNEINRVLKLKDDLIQELKNSLSEKNLEIRSLLEEVKLCRHEREQFSKQSGDQAASLAVANANLAHAKAEIAELDLIIANLQKELAQLKPRAAVVDDAKGDAKQLFNKLDEASSMISSLPSKPVVPTKEI